MKKIKIFCEGITDQVFISDCLQKFFKIEISKVENKKDEKKWDIFFGDNCQLMEIGGCSRLADDFYLDMLRDNAEEGGKNIVVFDADFSPNSPSIKKGTGNNGFDNAKKKLETLQKKAPFKFYLWPCHAHDGEIEDLLRILIPTKKEPIFSCLTSHHDCLKKSKIENLRIPDLKSQVGYYLHTASKDSKPRNRDYKEEEFWNLNCEEVEKLNTFKAFLSKFFPMTN